MTQFETSNYAKMLANNSAQSRELQRLQQEMAQMSEDNQTLDNYCSKLEVENARLRQRLARYEMFEGATKIWGYL